MVNAWRWIIGRPYVVTRLLIEPRPADAKYGADVFRWGRRMHSKPGYGMTKTEAARVALTNYFELAAKEHQKRSEQVTYYWNDVAQSNSEGKNN